MKTGGDLLSHGVAPAVPSAQQGLTTEFEKGSGVSPALSPPKNVTIAVPGKRTVFSKEHEASRLISTGRLNVLPHLHLRPIDLVFFKESSGDRSPREILS